MSRSRHNTGESMHESFTVTDSAGVVTGLVNGDFTKYVRRDGATVAVTVTVTEIANGEYDAAWTFPTTAGVYTLRITHATYNPAGWAASFDVEAYSAKDILEGDEDVDDTTDTALWRQTINKKGTATEIVRKKLRKRGSTAGSRSSVAATTDTVVSRKES